MDANQKRILEKVAQTIRKLSMEAVQKANSGHPGLPMGCAELGAYIYGHLLRHNPKNPRWLARDRFVLSAGHGSMLLYSCLHLAGFDLSIEEIEKFRQLHSRTPGHPEYRHTVGVEATTGPLGQGIGNAVGQALGMKILAARFNTEHYPLFNNKIYCLGGDGCFMEGIGSEASALAGHLCLDNLVLIYDSNKICLDGELKECASEDTAMRYKAYGFDVFEVDGYDFDAMDRVFTHIMETQRKPCLVIVHTIIGKGSPNKAGSHKVHGSPLGQEELEVTEKSLGISPEPFAVPPSVHEYFAARIPHQVQMEEKWKEMLRHFAEAKPEEYAILYQMVEKEIPATLEEDLKKLEMKSPIAGRSASQSVVNFLAKKIPSLIGGSADLSCSDLTMLKDYDLIKPHHFKGNNIKYGVREFAMAAMGAGLAQDDLFLPFIGTFLTFSDYMRNAIRLASLSKTHIVYQFTHDSIFLGEDGPTHQPVEHLASLRTIPGIHVIRPADANEVKMAWIAALRYLGPTVLALSRQNLPILAETNLSYEESVGRGAYVIRKEKHDKIDFVIIATGSEVWLALEVANALEKLGKSSRVISMPCWELFEKQPATYRKQVLPRQGKRVSIEAGVSFGWHKWIGEEGISISVDRFGASAPMQDLAQEYGFTVDSILDRLLS